MKYFIVLFFSFSQVSLAKSIPLKFNKLAKDTYVVVSQPYSVNSLLLKTVEGEVVVVDSPMTPSETQEIIEWSRAKWGKPPSFIFNSHWHFDATAGNGVLKSQGATIINSEITNELLLKEGRGSAQRFSASLRKEGYSIAKEVAKITPVISDIGLTIADKISMKIGGETVELIYPGHSHSRDSIGIFFKDRSLLYGGCAVRSDKKVGNVSEANFASWEIAMKRFMQLDAKIVIPGHGQRYDPEMLEETARLMARSKK